MAISFRKARRNSVLKKVFAFMFLTIGTLLTAQQTPTGSEPAPAQPAAPMVTEKPRVFITDSESWEMSGSAAGANGAFAAQSHGGARPQTAEIIKTFGERCPQVIVNNKQEIADYIVVLDHEGGKGYLRHRNKVAVFEHLSGDVIMSKSTLSVGGSVEDACNGIIPHWAAHSEELLAARGSRTTSLPAPPTTVPVAFPIPPAPLAQASLAIDSTPAGADIEIDGAFVGNTPSTLTLALGGHNVAIKKKGFTDWSKTLSVTGGTVHLNAELEQEPAKQ
jgi:hypothetical protein